MKDATGELNMTVIVIVGIAAVAAFFTVFILPSLQVSIANNQCEAECGGEDRVATVATRDTVDDGSFVCRCN